MTRRTLAVIAALGLALAACSGAQEKRFTKSDSDQIRQRTQDFVTAINAKDVVKAAEFYAGTATFMPPNAATMHGRDSVQLYYQTLIEGGTTDFTLEPKDIGGVLATAGPGLAFANGTYSMTLKSKTGTPVHDRGKYLFIMRNTGGQWRCEYSIWNSDLPRTEGTD